MLKLLWKKSKSVWGWLIKVEWLEQHTQGRDNNYNLIRLVAASAVIFGHSFRLSPMPGMRDPVSGYIQGTWTGAIAVEAFFLISGLLVTASVIRSRSIARYFKARVLRLMPALLVCLLLSVFVLGPALTSLPLADYYASPRTWQYLYVNASLVEPVFKLPGIFGDHPAKAVNGSLWTLPAEGRMYVILGVAGFVGLMKRRSSANALLALLVLIGLFLPEYLPLVNDNHRYYRLAIYFAAGAFLFVNRDYVPLNWLALFLLAGTMPWWHDSQHRLIILGALICYGVACIAYLQNWGWPRWMGDYSYGIYIYGWPSQQLAWLILPGALPIHNAVLAYGICVPIAVLSWHLVEKPALGLKNTNLVPAFLRPRVKKGARETP